MDFVLPVNQEEYESAGSKFISFPQPFVKGAVTYRKIECKNLDWDTPNKSMKVEIVVTEDGPDNNKEEKLSFGIDVKGVWKGKGIYKNITGREPESKKQSDGQFHPIFKSEAINGKPAVGMWQIVEGKKGGVGEPILYPKLIDILPADFKPAKDIV